jgi:RHS repeat-associated protein
LTLLTPQSRTIGYSYDNSGLLAWISAGPGNAYTRWFTLGGRDSLYLPDGSGTKYYYDGDALLKRIYTYHPNITPYQGKGIVDTYLYYNGAGRPDSMIDYSVYAQGASGDKTIFLYDGRGQLKNKSGPQTSDAYYYDGSGNRTAARFAGDSITYFTPSGTNRLQTSSAPLGTTTYFYNDNGAVVKDSTRQFYSAVSPSAFFRRIRKSYFDAAGRLTISKLDSLVYNSSGTLISTYSPAPLQYRYDAMGRQFIREPGTGGTILAVLDGNAMLGIGNMEIVDVGLDEPLMLLAPTGSAVCGVSTMYFVTNVNRLFDYHRPDGTTCIQSGNDGWETYGRQAGAIGDSYNFSLKNANGQSGLSFFRNRFYNPTSGRFTQEDPLGFAGGLNLYGYAGNNPATYTDPFGLCPPIEDCLRQAGSLVAGFLPGVSTVQDATTLVSGKDVLTGARVGAAGRLIAGIGLLTPFSGGEIAGGGKAVSVTKHYLDRKLERGVLSSEVWDALKNPLKVKGVKIDELGRPSQQIIGRGATVVQNPETGALINTWHTSSGLVKKLEQ